MVRPKNKENTVWDTGKELSDIQFGIAYSGKALLSRTRYRWKVRTWNTKNEMSPWSEPVSFVTGFLRPGDWATNTRWICLPSAVSKEVNSLPMFRKEFTIGKKVTSAYLYICGLGQFNSYLNGFKIGNPVLDPAKTEYSKVVNDVTFDITSTLKKGKNTLGVMLGNGLFARKQMSDFGPLVMIAQLHTNFVDGSSTDIVSDSTWKAHKSSFTLSNFDATEYYDARLDQEGRIRLALIYMFWGRYTKD